MRRENENVISCWEYINSKMLQDMSLGNDTGSKQKNLLNTSTKYIKRQKESVSESNNNLKESIPNGVRSLT